jgi:hypothetical protein
MQIDVVALVTGNALPLFTVIGLGLLEASITICRAPGK